MVRVLFVCLGNICRSPMAEALFRHLVGVAGLKEQVEADSAGTGHWHIGEPPHTGTRNILARNDIRYSGRARLIQPSDLNSFDYVVAMDSENLRDIEALGNGRAKVFRLLDLVPDAPTRDVPDPYLNGRFQEVYDLCLDGCTGLLDKIRAEQGL
jgi:protein-tyrosine phosphatase